MWEEDVKACYSWYISASQHPCEVGVFLSTETKRLISLVEARTCKRKTQRPQELQFPGCLGTHSLVSYHRAPHGAVSTVLLVS